MVFLDFVGWQKSNNVQVLKWCSSDDCLSIKWVFQQEKTQSILPSQFSKVSQAMKSSSI